MQTQMLTVDQAATLLGCCRRTVTKLIREGRLPAADISAGGKNARYRISLESLRDFMRGR